MQYTSAPWVNDNNAWLILKVLLIVGDFHIIFSTNGLGTIVRVLFAETLEITYIMIFCTRFYLCLTFVNNYLGSAC